MKILIVNHYDCRNKGDHSVLSAMLQTIGDNFTNSNTTILSHYPQLDQTRCNARILESIVVPSPGVFGKFQGIVDMIRCLAWAVTYRCFHINVNNLVSRRKMKTVKAYSDADVVLGRSIDWFNDVYGLKTFVTVYYEVLLSVIMGKKTVIYAQTIGPFRTNFKGQLYRVFLKALFKRLDLITVREKNSQRFLTSIGISDKVYVTADPAFLLRPISQQQANSLLVKIGVKLETSPTLVGLNLSQLGYRYSFADVVDNTAKYRKYTQLMADFIDYLTSNLNATIILIPHVFGPSKFDDRKVSSDVLRLVKDKTQVAILVDEHTPEVIRGVVGQLSLFIGMRMHSIIHALSTGVPTVAIDYMGKTAGIMELLSQQQLVVYSKDLTLDALLEKTSIALKNKQQIRESLLTNLPLIREKALQNIILVKQVVKNN